MTPAYTVRPIHGRFLIEETRDDGTRVPLEWHDTEDQAVRRMRALNQHAAGARAHNTKSNGKG